MDTIDNEIERLEQIQAEYIESEMKNLCIECGVDMGYMNPRQYCGKTFCYNSTENEKNS
jgi:hypothetical protein